MAMEYYGVRRVRDEEIKQKPRVIRTQVFIFINDIDVALAVDAAVRECFRTYLDRLVLVQR